MNVKVKTFFAQVGNHFQDDGFKTNQHVVSLWSSDKQSTLTISLIEDGFKVVQEKESTSEMFAVKLNLYDLQWHQIALR